MGDDHVQNPTELAVNVQASGSTGTGKWKISARATGLYGGALASAVAVVCLCAFGPEPVHSKHFLLVMLATFIAGAFTNAVISNARITDALTEKENYRREVERMAKDHRELNATILTKQLSSSTPPPAPAPTPKKKRPT